MFRLVLSVLSMSVVITVVILLQPATQALQANTEEFTASQAAAQLGICAETLLLCGASDAQAAGIRDKLLAAGPLRGEVALRQEALDSVNSALTQFLDATPTASRRTELAREQHAALTAAIDSARSSLRTAEAILQATVLSDLSASEQDAFVAAVNGMSSGIPVPYRVLDLSDADRKKLARALRQEEADRLDAERFDADTYAAMEPQLSTDNKQWLAELRGHVDYLAASQSLAQDLDTMAAILGL